MTPQNTETKETSTSIFLSSIFIFLLMSAIFAIDLQLPLGVAGGVPYVAVILFSLWLNNYKYVISLAIICSILTLIGFYFSPEGGELWKVIANRALALLVIWVTAVLAIKWETSQKRILQIKYKAKEEKEKIYLATIHGAQHVTNNLLNQLKLVELEIQNNPDFDKEVTELFNNMLIEANTLLKELSSVKHIEAEEIMQSVYPKSYNIQDSQAEQDKS